MLMLICTGIVPTAPSFTLFTHGEKFWACLHIESLLWPAGIGSVTRHHGCSCNKRISVDLLWNTGICAGALEQRLPGIQQIPLKHIAMQAWQFAYCHQYIQKEVLKRITCSYLQQERWVLWNLAICTLPALTTIRLHNSKDIQQRLV